jgi:hypothetical protein
MYPTMAQVIQRTDLLMKHRVIVPEELLRKVDECIALANASTNYKIQADQFAAALVYLDHYEEEVRAGRQSRRLLDRVH